jgi:hypothetical protein
MKKVKNTMNPFAQCNSDELIKSFEVTLSNDKLWHKRAMELINTMGDSIKIDKIKKKLKDF